MLLNELPSTIFYLETFDFQGVCEACVQRFEFGKQATGREDEENGSQEKGANGTPWYGHDGQRGVSSGDS